MGALSVLWAEMHSVSAFKWPKPMVWRHADCPYYVQEKHCACLVPPCKMLQQVLVHSNVPLGRPGKGTGLKCVCMMQVQC